MFTFEELIGQWASAACREWDYSDPSEAWLARVEARIPAGLRIAIARAVEDDLLQPVEGHRFRLTGLAANKGPYAFFSRSAQGEPSPNWEYFVQVAEYARLHRATSATGLELTFEDDLMDIAVTEERGLLWCIEVKEKAGSIDALVRGIRTHGNEVDLSAPDRGDDPLRKAKYLFRLRPRYFSVVAIGCRLDFSVSHTDTGFALTEDFVPID